MHRCTDSQKQQFLCMSRAAKERCTETHQPLHKPRIQPNSTYMFQCARKKQILDSQWEARGAEHLRSLYFQRILGDPRPAHWMSRLPAICAPIRHMGAYAAMETSINTTCECHCLANVITPIKGVLHLKPSHYGDTNDCGGAELWYPAFSLALSIDILNTPEHCYK